MIIINKIRINREYGNVSTRTLLNPLSTLIVNGHLDERHCFPKRMDAWRSIEAFERGDPDSMGACSIVWTVQNREESN
jgi:hypothetical protein